MKALSLTFCIVLFSFQAFAQYHFIGVGANISMGSLGVVGAEGGGRKPMGIVSIAYKFIGKKEVGFSLALESSGYTFSQHNGKSDKSSSYINVYNSSVYLTTPFMMEVLGGKRRCSFMFHAGVLVNFALYHKAGYDYYAYYLPTFALVKEEHPRIAYNAFTPIHIGLPVGIGLGVVLSKSLSLNLSIEDRLFIKRLDSYNGIINTLGLKVELAFNLKRNNSFATKADGKTGTR
ncbi:MAG: hypothetical protein U0V74_04495 [Chitinophagales bacterium]